MHYSRGMNKDSAFLPSLLPLAVVAAGLDFIAGNPLMHAFLSTLSQNGF